MIRVFKGILAGAAVLALGLAANAQEVAEGNWINLFDGETTYGWIQQGDVEWTVKDGVLVGGERGGNGFLATTSQFTNYELTLQIKLNREGTASVLCMTPLEGHPSETGAGEVLLECKERKGGDWQEVRIRAAGHQHEAWVNGEPVANFNCTRHIGHIALGFHTYHSKSRGQEIEVKDIKLRPLGLKPIFNGTDLSGWNILPDHKSEFSVDNGAIRIVNGNGQIETDALYKNFLLQLDVFSNGDHLNSGVFFRGPKGVFWKGYESQVRNEWVGEDRTKPVDFGTGGLYGIDPTRKVIPSDREWFSKTIVANGNHFAVWVNGYQVSDYTDTRPLSPEKDGKNGYVSDAGTIHLQGHDPTTDLSFKNINILEYPAE